MDGKGELLVLLRVEMILSCLIALLLNMLWDPFIDRITGGKYGFVNTRNIFVLASCMPFLYLNNFLWTVNFAKGRMRPIFWVSMVAFLVNLSGDVILIPFLQGFGAAIAFLAAVFIQAVLYTRLTGVGSINKAWISLLCCAVGALASGLLSRHLFTDVYARAAFSVCAYLALLLPAGQLRPADWRILRMRAGI